MHRFGDRGGQASTEQGCQEIPGRVVLGVRNISYQLPTVLEHQIA
jgi:hypothetical protein